jgi:hypothetical protein
MMTSLPPAWPNSIDQSGGGGEVDRLAGEVAQQGRSILRGLNVDHLVGLVEQQRSAVRRRRDACDIDRPVGLVPEQLAIVQSGLNADDIADLAGAVRYNFQSLLADQRDSGRKAQQLVVVLWNEIAHLVRTGRLDAVKSRRAEHMPAGSERRGQPEKLGPFIERAGRVRGKRQAARWKHDAVFRCAAGRKPAVEIRRCDRAGLLDVGRKRRLRFRRMRDQQQTQNGQRLRGGFENCCDDPLVSQ